MNKKVLYVLLFFLILFNLIFDFNVKNYFYILNLCFDKNIVLTTNLYILICAIFCLILVLLCLDILLVIYKGKNKNKGLKIKTDDTTHGSANWMNGDEISDVLGTGNTPGIILGKNADKLIKLPFDSYFNKNICVFGSSR